MCGREVALALLSRLLENRIIQLVNKVVYNLKL